MTSLIHWQHWDDATLAHAKAENKPIFLSIGYFSCYWCHAMDHQVYSEPALAEVLNRDFIPIKIDKDERPDLDEIYMLARQLVTGHSGWPNHVFLTPEANPFLATGVMMRKAGTGKSLQDMVVEVSKKWGENQPAIIQASQQIAKVLQEELSMTDASSSFVKPDKTVTDNFFKYLQENYDAEHGGFYSSPKFAHENYLLFLLADYRYRKDMGALEMAAQSLKKMAAGGIYDHIGGGFHRYTEDREWNVPHFEKMLTTQALQARCLVELYEISGKAYHKNLTTQTLDFVLRELRDPKGGFYSALDAETDGVEGAYYVWQEHELQKLLNQRQRELFAKCYRLLDIPQQPGHPAVLGGALRARQHLVALANEKNRSYESLHEELVPIFATILEARSQRQRPERDEKIITAWNGLMIETLAEAGRILERADYLQAAKEAAEFIWKELRLDGGFIARFWHAGKASDHGYLEDYAYLESAFISLYESTQDKSWLDKAMALHSKTDELFWDAAKGGYFITDGKENLLVRIHRAHDNGLPSASGEMLHNTLRLYDLTADEQWLGKAHVMIETYQHAMQKTPQDYSTMLQAMLYLYR